MKQFLKFIFASCLGTLLVIGLIILSFVIIVQVNQPDYSISKKSVLKLELSDPIPELTDNVQESPFNLESKKILGLQEITELIEHANSDEDIEALLINTQFPMLGPASSEAIFRAIESFKNSGKPVYAYGDYYSQGGYYLASLADSVFLNPNGFIELRGYAAIVPFYKDLMEKLGIKMNVYYAGKYKSATESFREDDMTAENKYQTREYLNDISAQMFDKIAEHRDKSSIELQGIVSNFSSHNAEAALELGLADQLSYWGDFEDQLEARLNLEGKSPEYVNLVEYSNYVNQSKKFKTQKNKIAVVHAEGEILYESDKKGVVSFDKYAKILRKLAKKKDVKAVVLRINSPGGSALASDLLWKEIKDLQDSGKKVVSSFGNYAASGGYYIAAPSDHIVAEKNSLTGSIGAYLMIPEATELFEEKIGIHFDTVKTHPFSVIWNPLFNVQDKEAKITEQMTESLYQQFLARVADGRNMSVEEVHERAQGRIWSGMDALEAGLVDDLGDLQTAIDKGAELAELENYKLISYPKIEKNIYLEMLSSMMGESNTSAGLLSENIRSEYLPLLEYFKTLSQQQGPQMRLPFYLDIQ